MSILTSLLSLAKKKERPQPQQFLKTPTTPIPIQARPNQLGGGSTYEADSPITRPRVADPYGRLKNRQLELATAPLGATPSRWKGLLYGMLSNAGRSANRALDQGNVGWGGVAQVAGGAAGGAAAGAADPQVILRDRRELEMSENQANLDRVSQTMSNEGQLDSLKARAEGERADAEYKKSLPAIKLQERKDEQTQREFENNIERRKLELEEKVKNGELSWREAQVEIDRLNAKSGIMNAETNRFRTQHGIDQEIGEATNKRGAMLNQSSAFYKKADSNDDYAKQLEKTLKDIPQDTYDGQQESERRKKLIDSLRGEARELRKEGDKARASGEGTYVAPARQRSVKPKSDPLGIF